MSSSKRHFTAVIGKKEQGSYVSSSPSSAARKAVSKLCADDKKRKVVFSVRETTQNSNKKVYGPYIGYMQKLDKPVELKGRVIRYKPVAKLDKKLGAKKGGGFFSLKSEDFLANNGSKSLLKSFHNNESQYRYISPRVGKNKLFFGKKFENNTKYYFPIAILSDGSFRILTLDAGSLVIRKFKGEAVTNVNIIPHLELFKDNLPDRKEQFGDKINETLEIFRKAIPQKTSNNSRGVTQERKNNNSRGVTQEIMNNNSRGVTQRRNNSEFTQQNTSVNSTGVPQEIMNNPELTQSNNYNNFGEITQIRTFLPYLTEDDDFDSQEKYKNYWFTELSRTNGCDIEVDKIYKIRFKGHSEIIELYKVIEKKGNKIKLARLKRFKNITNEHPKILIVDMDTIYGYEYIPDKTQNVSVYTEFE
jgi:hypothetical protein